MTFDEQVDRKEGSVEQMMAAAARSRVQHQLRSVLPVNAVEDTVFSVAYITTTDNEMPNVATWILTLLDDFQLLSFALNPHIHHDIPFALAAFMEPTRLLDSYASFSIANALALAMVFSTISLAAVVSLLMHRQTKVPILALRALRVLFTLIVSTLNIPIATLFVGGINCSLTKGDLQPFDIPCFRGSHLPLVFFNALGLFMFIPLILLASVVLIETSPTSTSPSAKAHGHVELRSMALRIVFVILDAVTPTIESDVATWLYMVVTALGLLYLTVQLIQQQPYYDSRVTMLRSGLTFASATAMIANMVLAASRQIDRGSWVYSLPAAAAGFIAAAIGSKAYASRHLERTVCHWYEVCRRELLNQDDEPVRNSIHAIGQHTLERMKRRLSDSNPNSPPLTPRRLSSSILSSRSKISSLFNLPAMSEANGIINELLSDSSTEVLRKVDEMVEKKREKVFDSPLQVEVCVRFIRKNPTEVQVVLALQLLERGLYEFPSDPLLLLLTATYLAEFYGVEGQRAADMLIRQLHHGSRAVPLAVKYLAYAQERSTRDRGEHVLDKAALDALNSEVRKSHLRAMGLVRNAWDAIRTGAPLSKLAVIVSDLSRYQVQTNSTYQRLMEKTPTTALRAYAQFLLSCQGDAFKAEQLLERAEDVELQEMKQRQQKAAQRVDVRRASVLSGGAKQQPSIQGSKAIAPPPSGRRPTFASVPHLSPGKPIGHSGPLETHSSRIAFGSTAAVHKGAMHDVLKSTGGLSTSDSNGAGAISNSRLRSTQRRVLCERLARPLKTKVPLLLMGTVFLCTISFGLHYCLDFFDRSLTLIDDFMNSRTVRSNAVDTLYAVRTVALTRSRLALHGEFRIASSHMRNQTLPVLTLAMQQMGNWKGHLSDQGIDVPTFQIVSAQKLALADISPLDVVNRVMQAANLVIDEIDPNAAARSPVWSSSSLLFLPDNFNVIIEALMRVAQLSVDEYNQLISWSEAYLLGSMLGAVASLIGLGVLVYSLMISTYFRQEDRVLQMLLQIPKKTATSLLTQAEEDLESFREVTELDGTDELRTLHSGSGSSFYSWLFSGNKRPVKVKTVIASIIIVIGSLVCAMIGAPLMSAGLQGQIDWLVTSGNGRYRMQSWMVYSQEALLADGSMPYSSIVKYIRGTVHNIALDHSKLEAISSIINQLFPNATIYPRNCTLVSSCPAAEDLPDIGFTRHVATMSLDAERDLLISALHVVSDHLATRQNLDSNQTGDLSIDTNSQAFKAWLYGRAIARDVVDRVQTVHAFALARIHREIGSLVLLCVGLFALTLAAFGCAGYMLYKVVVTRMTNRIEAIVSLMFLVGGEHLHEVPELAKLIDTGGLLLFVKSNQDEVSGG